MWLQKIDIFFLVIKRKGALEETTKVLKTCI